jgi:phage shock protein A
MDNAPQQFTPKTFWQRPEGTTGMLFMGGILLGGGYLLYKILPTLIDLLQNTLYAGLLMGALALVIYMVLDPKVRGIFSYGYKAIMRWITGIFVQIDPIGILKSYIEDLQDNLVKMNKQISQLRGQMFKLKEVMTKNQQEIKNSLNLATRAKETDNQSMMVLKARRAGRLQDSNMKYDDLYKKMEILYRVLTKMYENSEIMLEDIKDQVNVKEQERAAIHASHSAMKSAMNIIAGNSDKRYMFDMALEAIADDVSNKVGEMERFMEMSNGFMNSVDLQNGVFEEEGMALLDKWEKEGPSLLLPEKEKLLLYNNGIDTSAAPTAPSSGRANQYDHLF